MWYIEAIKDQSGVMSQSQDNFKRGTAELLILYLLQEEELYGYRIIQLFNEKSGGRYTMLEGTLYTILFRLENAGFVSQRVELVGKKRTRRVYNITDSGRKYLETLIREYDEIVAGVDMILDRRGGADLEE